MGLRAAGTASTGIADDKPGWLSLSWPGSNHDPNEPRSAQVT
jgi:hypothetical protein